MLMSPNADAKVRGLNVRSAIDAFGLLPHVGASILARYGIRREDLRADTFVPLQSFLSTLEDVRSLLGSESLRTVGHRTVSMALVPPQFDTVEKMLLALDVIYQANHQGDVGHYRVTQPDADTIIVRCETPYPPEAEQGIIEGFTMHPNFRRRKHTVEIVPGDNITHSCTLIVRRVKRERRAPSAL